jgi:phosphate transport system substrate-binding protein
MMKLRLPLVATALALLCAGAAPGEAPGPDQAAAEAPWLRQYQPNAESRRFAAGSAAERRARMAARARAPAYSRKFDLSGLPPYQPKLKPTGTLRICGNNYVGDSPLGGWWKAAFEKFQPGITIHYDLQTAADAIACLYLNVADIGIDHDPSFYDDLAHLRLKGYVATGFSVLTGSYDVIGWQNTFAIIVNSANPIARISLPQLDGVFGSQRAGGWVRATWHPELARGPQADIRSWGQLGLGGRWADQPIDTYGYSLRYQTAIEFSDKVLSASDKWNANLLAFGNFVRPDGSTYLEADQIVDHVKNDLDGIGYIRYHAGLPSGVKVLALASSTAGPYISLTLDTEQDRSYPLWGDQGFWVSAEPGQPLKPAVYEFIRFVLSRDGQELIERDGKYLPLTAQVAAEQMRRLDAVAAGRRAD